MPKLSVYVSDDLWGKACKMDPLAKPSQLVQRGLDCLVKGHPGETPHGTPPAEVAERIEALRGTFAAQARAEYEVGYAGALEAAEGIPWFALEDFANDKFDVRRWIDGWRRSATSMAAYESPPAWLGAVAKILGKLADPIGFDAFSFTPTRARVRGFGDALRLVWQSVDLDTLGLASDKGADSQPEAGSNA